LLAERASVAVSAEAAELISVDFRSVGSCLFDFLFKGIPVWDFSGKDIVGIESVELPMGPAIKLDHCLFENLHDIIIRIRLLREEVFVFHGLVARFGHAVGEEYFNLRDDSSDENVLSLEKDGDVAFILGSIVAHEFDFSVKEVKSFAYPNQISRRIERTSIKRRLPSEDGPGEV
jgi:hypothetical protein